MAEIEGQGEFRLPQTVVGDDAVELDRHVLSRFGLPAPDYITRLEEEYCNAGI